MYDLLITDGTRRMPACSSVVRGNRSAFTPRGSDERPHQSYHGEHRKEGSADNLHAERCRARRVVDVCEREAHESGKIQNATHHGRRRRRKSPDVAQKINTDGGYGQQKYEGEATKGSRL